MFELCTFTSGRYANRAKNIKNKPRINEDPKDALLREYQEEIVRLKGALGKRKGKGQKRRRRRTESGGEGEGVGVQTSHTHAHTHTHTVVSGEESGEEDEGEQAEASLKVKQSQLEAEKQAILQNKELLDEVGVVHGEGWPYCQLMNLLARLVYRDHGSHCMDS